MVSKAVSASRRGGSMLSPDLARTAADDTGLFPSAEVVVEAGTIGAVMGGVGSGIAGTLAVRSGESTVKDVAAEVGRNTVNGALTLSVATVVAHMVRARPVLGVGLIAVVGLGALALLRRKPSEDVVP